MDIVDLRSDDIVLGKVFCFHKEEHIFSQESLGEGCLRRFVEANDLAQHQPE